MLHRHAFHAMGCDMLAVVDTEEEAPPPQLAAVPEWFEEWENILSRFRLDSELSRLNRSPDQPLPVSDTLWEVYQAARAAESLSAGLVTPTVGEAVIRAGYDRSFELLPAEREELPGFPTASSSSPDAVILADPQAHTLCLPPGMQLDLGGVAKGWAAHRAMLRLAPLGPALVDAGGDIAISQPLPGGEPWKIGVTDPFHEDQNLLMLYVRGCGVATSGKNRRRWKRGDRTLHHIIDPRTSQPAGTDILTATVIAPTLMEAETAAKCMLILGSEAGLAWLERDPALAALLVLEDGRLLASRTMQEYYL